MSHIPGLSFFFFVLLFAVVLPCGDDYHQMALPVGLIRIYRRVQIRHHIVRIPRREVTLTACNYFNSQLYVHSIFRYGDRLVCVMLLSLKCLVLFSWQRLSNWLLLSPWVVSWHRLNVLLMHMPPRSLFLSAFLVISLPLRQCCVFSHLCSFLLHTSLFLFFYFFLLVLCVFLFGLDFLSGRQASIYGYGTCIRRPFAPWKGKFTNKKTNYRGENGINLKKSKCRATLL